MKVYDLLRKFNMCSNSAVIIQCKEDGVLMELDREDIQSFKPNWAMMATVNSFDVIDNVMTIYIKGAK